MNDKELIEKRKEVGSRLRDKREEKGLSQQRLAEKMEISTTTISKIEAGKWNFGINTVILYGEHLGFQVAFK